MKVSMLLAITVGAGLTAWSGAALNTELGFTGAGGIHLAMFAVGIVLLSQVPTIGLAARLAHLESLLSGSKRPN